MTTTEYEISLTGPQSHVLRVPSGAGNLYIGPEKQPPGTPQAIVGENDVLDWGVLDSIGTRGAYLWPRQIYYEGNDSGVFRWAAHRRVETLEWTPSRPLRVDARTAKIRRLIVCLEASALEIDLPDEVCLTVMGTPRMLDPRHGADGEGVSLSFTGLGVGQDIPLYPHLAGVRSLHVGSGGVAIDGGALCRYEDVRTLAISGPLVAAADLVKMKALRRIELREVWNLSCFPKLDSWESLEVFMAFHVPRAEGRRLRAEAKKLAGVESTIRKLHSPEWIAKNARSPFRRWGDALRVPAQGAFADAATQLESAQGTEAVRRVIETFLDALNVIDEKRGLMTGEREDAAAAVDLLVCEAGHRELRESAQEWFAARSEFRPPHVFRDLPRRRELSRRRAL